MKKFLAMICLKINSTALLILVGLFAACQGEHEDRTLISEFVCRSISSDIVIDNKGKSVAIFFDNQSDTLAKECLLALNDSIMIGFDESEEGRNLTLIGYLKAAPAKSTNVGGRPSAPKIPFVLLAWKLNAPYREFAKEDGEIDRELVIRAELKPSDFTSPGYFEKIKFDENGKFYWCGKLYAGKAR